MPNLVRALCGVLFLVSAMSAQDRSHARSMVITPLRHRSYQPRASFGRRRAGSGKGRFRSGRGNCRQRCPGRDRTHDERYWRRSICDFLGREKRKALRTQRQRLGPGRAHDRTSEVEGHNEDAGVWHRLRNGPRRGCRLAGVTPALRAFAAGRIFSNRQFSMPTRAIRSPR